MMYRVCVFFNDTATTEIYTLSLHGALPICRILPQALLRELAQQFVDAEAPLGLAAQQGLVQQRRQRGERRPGDRLDRKSTRLNSSHANISYAVFCLKKKPLCIPYSFRCLLS